MKKGFETYFHLGLPKVASTFLQKEIFPNLINLEFHRKRKFNDFKHLKSENLTHDHLFSYELDRGLEGTVEEIAALLPEAKFIFLVRRHDRWILSKYKYYIRKHGWKSFDEFFDLESNEGIWKREALFFRNKIEHIAKYSKTRPLVLTHDLLQSNPDLFFQKITQYTNTTLDTKARKHVVVKKAFNEKQLIVLRRFNQMYRYKTAQTSSKFLNKVHHKYREFLLHTVAFFSQLVPAFIIGRKSLLKDSNALDEIRNYYREDWEYCEEYARMRELQK